jgi:serine protease
MRTKKFIAFLILFISCFGPVTAQTVHTKYVDGSVYLKLRDTCTLELAPYNFSNLALNAEFLQYGVLVPGIRKPFPDVSISTSLTKIYHLHCTDSVHIDSLIAGLIKIPIIEYAEKEPLIKVFYTPNDVNSNQWHLGKIDASNAWNFTHGSANVVVAIVDNGVRTTHSDLAPNLWTNSSEIPNNFFDDDLNGYTDDINGYDVSDNDNNPNPPGGTTNTSPFGHGTHCAGIAAAATDNNKGIASIGFNTRIMAVKCTPDNNDGNTMTNAYDGVYYAMRARANVISMSWGGTGGFTTGQSVINTAYQRGIVLVAAAGNNDSNGVDYPAAYSNVIAVGSSDVNDLKSTFSNYGTGIDVMAPGSYIYSTLAGDDNAYGFQSGTSMATPLVAGLAALVKAANPSFTPLQIITAIKAGCDNINTTNPNFIGKLGAGRINAYRTFQPGSGISPQQGEFAFDVFPNPCSSLLQFSIAEKSNSLLSIQLTGMQGQTVLREHIQVPAGTNRNTLNVGNIAAGLYFLTVTDDERTYFRKVVIE